jgi:quercetin dioxygenase-like cupin family protein
VPGAGDVIEGPNGYRLRLVRTGAETDGELLEMEATYAGEGPPPPEHLHPHQEERFVVLKGSVRARIDGAERVYLMGERFVIPAGTAHTISATEPARIRWEVRPALRTAEFFVRLYGSGAGEGFLEEFAEEFRLT